MKLISKKKKKRLTAELNVKFLQNITVFKKSHQRNVRKVFFFYFSKKIERLKNYALSRYCHG